MGKIDLHCHSHCSDGELSPGAVVVRAFEQGVSLLALTDHDTVAGVPEAMEAAARLGMTLIPAMELSTLWNGMNIHVVALNIDLDSSVLQKALERQAGARERRGRLIGEKLERQGIAGAYEAALALADRPESLGRTHFAQMLLEAGRVSRLQQAFDKYLGAGKVADVPIPWVTLEEGVGVIREAGGIAVLAHPAQYRMTRTKLRRLIDAFAKAGGQAMEVVSATQSPDIIPWLALTAESFGLMASQGSDFHGSHMPWIELGRFPSLPATCRPVWSSW